ADGSGLTAGDSAAVEGAAEAGGEGAAADPLGAADRAGPLELPGGYVHVGRLTATGAHAATPTATSPPPAARITADADEPTTGRAQQCASADGSRLGGGGIGGLGREVGTVFVSRACQGVHGLHLA